MICFRDILLSGTSYLDCEDQERSLREYRLINLNESEVLNNTQDFIARIISRL